MRVVGGVSSELCKVSSGAAQGSVLEPVLFLVYVNFLTNGIGSNDEAFAGDYKIYLQHPRNATREEMNTLQGDLNRLDLVASSWNFSLNRNKCVIKQFSRHFSG